MGWYDVAKPCVVGQLHYVRPTDQPIQADDDVAAPLVEEGSLKPYQPGESMLDGVIRTVDSLGGEFAEIGRQAVEDFTAGVDDTVDEPPAPPRARGRRRSSEG